VEAFARDSAAFGKQTGKPLVIAATQRSVADQFSSEGLSVFPTETEAVAALQPVSRPSRIDGADARADERSAPRLARRRFHPPATSMLNEADSLACWPRAAPEVPHRCSRSRAEAVAAFETIGGPVVVKGCSADTPKIRTRTCQTRVRTREEAGLVWAQMEEIIRKHGARFDGVIVAAMAGGRREIMIGAHRDPCSVRGRGRRRPANMSRFFATRRCCCRRSPAGRQGGAGKIADRAAYLTAYAASAMDVRCVSDAVVKVGELMLDPGNKSDELDPQSGAAG